MSVHRAKGPHSCDGSATSELESFLQQDGRGAVVAGAPECMGEQGTAPAPPHPRTPTGQRCAESEDPTARSLAEIWSGVPLLLQGHTELGLVHRCGVERVCVYAFHYLRSSV